MHVLADLLMYMYIFILQKFSMYIRGVILKTVKYRSLNNFRCIIAVNIWFGIQSSYNNKCFHSL